jgi:hypothetical protein
MISMTLFDCCWSSSSAGVMVGWWILFWLGLLDVMASTAYRKISLSLSNLKKEKKEKKKMCIIY